MLKPLGAPGFSLGSGGSQSASTSTSHKAAVQLLMDLALLQTQDEFVEKYQHALTPDGNGALFFEPAFAITGKRAVDLAEVRTHLADVLDDEQPDGGTGMRIRDQYTQS